MKTLLTGAGGLVGSTMEADVRVIGRKPPFPGYKEHKKRWVDLTNWKDAYNLFQETKPTHVIHTAARVGGLGANMNYMAEFYTQNTAINLNVLEAARKAGVKKVVSFLSTCIFPDDVEYPLCEHMLHDGAPHTSNFGYSYAKRMLDVHSRAIKDQYGLNYICVIPTNIYGPNDNFNLDDSHVVPALIHKCYLAKKNKTDLVVWGSGKPIREFIYSEDVGELTQLILDEYDGPGPLIISSGEEISIKDLVDLIVKAMKFKGKVVFDDSKPDGQYRKTTSNLLLRHRFPEYKFTKLKQGIKKTVDWFVENYESCRK
jgi:GDP-L-fucose synthase